LKSHHPNITCAEPHRATNMATIPNLDKFYGKMALAKYTNEQKEISYDDIIYMGRTIDDCLNEFVGADCESPLTIPFTSQEFETFIKVFNFYLRTYGSIKVKTEQQIFWQRHDFTLLVKCFCIQDYLQCYIPFIDILTIIQTSAQLEEILLRDDVPFLVIEKYLATNDMKTDDKLAIVVDVKHGIVIDYLIKHIEDLHSITNHRIIARYGIAILTKLLSNDNKNLRSIERIMKYLNICSDSWSINHKHNEIIEILVIVKDIDIQYYNILLKIHLCENPGGKLAIFNTLNNLFEKSKKPS